jgi:hypothetical protein
MVAIPKIYKILNPSYILLFLVLLSACGGGSGSTNTTNDNAVSDGGAQDTEIIGPPSSNLSNKPFGIFALDSAQGTFRDANIRNYPFVRGYAWRQGWSDFEIADGVYDFSALDHIVSRLSDVNLKLSLLLFVAEPPLHLLSDPEIDTWIDGSDTRPNPWDTDLHQHFADFINALANHAMPDPTVNGDLVPFKNHSVLEVMHPGIPGLPRGSLRNGESTNVSDIPGYSRENLFNAIDSALMTFTTEFPNQPHLVSLWTINDSQQNPSLWQAARDRALNFDNIGFWQDNLAANRPCEDCEPVTGLPVLEGIGQPLIPEPGSFSGFQMLTSWLTPFNPNYIDNVTFGTPMDGMTWAMEAYDSLYFEVYTDDLDHIVWQDAFTDWAILLEQSASE